MPTKESEVLVKTLKRIKTINKPLNLVSIQEWKKSKRDKEIQEFKDFSASLKLQPLYQEDPLMNVDWSSYSRSINLYNKK